jgi:hypothetical protein
MGQSCTINRKGLGGICHDLLEGVTLNDVREVCFKQKFKTAIYGHKSTMLLVEMTS